ncbi:MAG: phosphoribosylformylglycinamidine synthase subunit PurS [Phycisphaerae bacterium]
MNVYRIDIGPVATGEPGVADSPLRAALRDAGLATIDAVQSMRIVLIETAAHLDAIEHVARTLLTDPVTERFSIYTEGAQPTTPAGDHSIEVIPQPGVTDPVAESIFAELHACGLEAASVRTGRRYVVRGPVSDAELLRVFRRALANEVIETVAVGTVGVPAPPQPPQHRFQRREIAIRGLDDNALTRLAREGHLFLSLDEMRAIRNHFEAAGRDPTDLELETLAQTWSEHCVHKTFKSAVVYRGAPLPAPAGTAGRATHAPSAACGETVELRFDNLLRDTIARATETLTRTGRGPACLSVFKDNAGVIAFDEHFGVAFKVETHNRPSAIEPYGGAATGVGGCIRDVIGCGLGAKPIANTDVFCVAPQDWPDDALPRGVLHPRRILNNVVRGVADYGNRMGIPTVSGAVCVDPRYLGNPLVYCGCVGLIPRDKVRKAPQPGDRIVVIGGRTGRDGIHGATFSSAELSDTHADEFSHAVQIGNAITQKRLLDAILQARDDAGGCVYTALTDCGAGGLSSAVGEMAQAIGATVELERVPLKYSGLRYDEIWISEAQERMVLAVPPERVARFLEIAAEHEAEATAIGAFGCLDVNGAPVLETRYAGAVVGRLDMRFLHDGLPRRTLSATWTHRAKPDDTPPRATDSTSRPRSPEPGDTQDDAACLAALRGRLASPDTASKAWIIRRYDHEVQGGAVVHALGGPGRGPNDAAVLRPRLDSVRGIAMGCGIRPQLFDVDPYWMAAAAIDEAVRNVVAVGADAGQIAILDNFCWGRCDDPQQMGALVRACQACHDAALAYGVPFISGKDSLNNEFALHDDDVAPLLRVLRRLADADPGPDWAAALPAVEERIQRTRRLSIPGTLLISAIGVVADTRLCVTADLKQPGHEIALVGGFSPTGFNLDDAARVHAFVGGAIAGGGVAACHDASDGGWLTALAEMAFGGRRGVRVTDDALRAMGPFGDLVAAYVVEAVDARALRESAQRAGVAIRTLAHTAPHARFELPRAAADLRELYRAWQPTVG